MKNNTIIVALIVAAAFFTLGKFSSQYKLVKDGPGVQGTVDEIQPSQPQEAPPAPEVTYENVRPVDDSDHIRGNKNAKITLIEYSDTECPYCKKHHDTMLKIFENYSDQIAWVYRHYPLPFHQYAQKEAEATECVADLGGTEKFWTYLDAIYKETTSNDGLDPQRLAPLAAEIGLDASAIQDCIDSGKFAQNVADDLSGGQIAGVQGTPGTILITKDKEVELIGGALPYEQIEATLKKYL